MTPSNSGQGEGRDREQDGAWTQLEPPSISSPKGGGAIRGLGEKFAVNPSNGTASLSVPLPLSPGRDGMTPQLTLAYDSGAPNGPFGLGWSVGVGSITRRTDKGLPRYVESGPDADVFVLSGAEDLVPVSGPAASAPRALPDGSAWRVDRFKPRVEGLFARIERWTPADGGAAHWRSISKEGVISCYGTTPESRVADPADQARVFSWLISETYNLKGNAMLFRYKEEDSSGVDSGLAHERNRTEATRATNRYLKRVLYANPTPRADGEDLTARQDWLFELVLDYGEHDPEDPKPSDAGTWGTREDPFSSYRAGFEVRTYRLCRRALMFHNFPNERVGAECLVRSLDLRYADSPVATKLVSITQTGCRRSGGAYVKRSLPPLELEYSEAQVQSEVIEIDAENLPEGIAGAYQLIDLDGEGLPGVITEQGGEWLYRRNVSPLTLTEEVGGRWTAAFAALESERDRPSAADLTDGLHQFVDLDGDGRLELAQLERPLPGYYSRGEEEGWEAFQPFASVPQVSKREPNLRLADLTGDGHADALITEEGAIRWYPSLAELGFGEEERSLQSFDEERGPRLLFADGTQSVYLADLSGDGLPDLVRIRSGEVCYWPNVGYGSFGAKVTMDNSPVFDTAEAFDQRRVRLADVDGSGPTDLVYIGSHAVQLYANQAGNSYAEAVVLDNLPDVAEPAGVAVADLLGNGTSCLVWSSALPATERAPLRYVDLMGGNKPHLLVRVVNNLGAETVVGHVASTKFYVQDRAEGNPWITRLAFPVQVVERVETYDRVSQNRFVTRYAYHHGYFDSVEREFRGFARVDQWDTEELAALAAAGALATSNEDSASQVPPVLTKSWYHTGAYLDAARISKQLAHEYYREGEPDDGLSALTDAQAAAMELVDTPLPATILKPDGTREAYALQPEEEREACRALKGLLLRQEVYGLDGGARAERPYSVSERNYTLELLQPQGEHRHAVFYPYPRESIELYYERAAFDVGANVVADPRVTSSFTLEVDAFGNVLRSASVAYGRRYDDGAPELSAADHERQRQALMSSQELAYTNAIDEEDAYRAPLPCETRAYELIGVTPTSQVAGTTNLFVFDELAQRIAESTQHEVPPEDVGATGATPGVPNRRLLRQTRAIFRRDDLSAPLPLGRLEPLALRHESYRLAFTPGLITGVYARKKPDGTSEALIADALATLGGIGGDGGGYVRGADLKGQGVFPAGDADADWWLPSGGVHLSSGSSDSAAVELAYAQAHFFVPVRYEDPFGHSVVVQRDGYVLLVLEVIDAAGNVVTAGARNAGGVLENGNDYRVLQPTLVTDPNGNRTETAYDALSLVTAVAVMGKEGEALGDSLAGVEVDLEEAALAAHMNEPLVNPEAVLARATSRYLYDVHAYARTAGEAQPQPCVSYALARETHDSELGPGESTRVQHRFAYSDGFGRQIQLKALAPPEGANARWIGSGWKIYNNKGNPVRQYEPFFTATHGFELARQVGVSPIVLYDPAQRVLATLHPQHIWEKVVRGPWREETWDVNDTVLTSDPASDPDVGATIGRLPAADYTPTWYEARAAGTLGADQQSAALKTARHAGTPLASYFDPLGRTFLTVSHNRYVDEGGNTVESKPATRRSLDIEGNQRAVIDALGRTAERASYDLGGTRIHQASMDAGERWTLNDAAAKAIRNWDSRGHAFRTSYDELRRPVEVHLSTWSRAETLEQRTLYGEGQPNPKAANLRMHVYQVQDGAGKLTTALYDFKGNSLGSVREIAVDYHAPIDWSGPVGVEDEFRTSTSYDALNRPIQSTSPDGSVAKRSYNEAGLVHRVEVTAKGAAAATAYVQHVDYNARGQRTAVLYGNGAESSYEYDPLTFRLEHMKTLRGGAGPSNLQNLTYVYDPIGNVVSITDGAQQTIFFDNREVTPRSDYTFDALYRLVEATGREHLGQNPSPTSWNDAGRTGILSPSDGNAMGRYQEQYVYDDVGNVLALAHHGTDPANAGWRQAYTYQTPSLLEAAHAGNRLSSTEVGAGGAEPCSYDEHGNLTGMPALTSIAWDARDRMQASSQQIVGAGATPQRTYYVYDGTGARVRKVTDREAAAGANPTRMNERIYVGGFEVYRKYDATGTNVELERQMLHVGYGDERVALVESRTLGNDPAPAELARYQLTNHLGSCVIELAKDAAVIAYEEYYPYGGTSYQGVRSATETPRRYRWSGKERDEESGLYYHGARYYAPWLARWISCDPAGTAASPNLFAYCRNNPVTRTDPTGTQDEPPRRDPAAGLVANAAAAAGSSLQPVTVATPYGSASQNPLMLDTKAAVQQGQPVYRAGNFERAPVSNNIVQLGPPGSHGAEAQTWSLTNPNTNAATYAADTGAASLGNQPPDWTMRARITPGEEFVVRGSPPPGGDAYGSANPGGAPEVVLEPGSVGGKVPPLAEPPAVPAARLRVSVDYFHMPDPPAEQSAAVSSGGTVTDPISSSGPGTGVSGAIRVGGRLINAVGAGLALLGAGASGFQVGQGLVALENRHVASGLTDIASGTASLGMNIAATQAVTAGTVSGAALMLPALAAGGGIWTTTETVHAAIEGRETPIDVADKFYGTHFGDVYGWITGAYRGH